MQEVFRDKVVRVNNLLVPENKTTSKHHKNKPHLNNNKTRSIILWNKGPWGDLSVTEWLDASLLRPNVAVQLKLGQIKEITRRTLSLSQHVNFPPLSFITISQASSIFRTTIHKKKCFQYKLQTLYWIIFFYYRFVLFFKFSTFCIGLIKFTNLKEFNKTKYITRVNYF